jgi:hypothetical protein
VTLNGQLLLAALNLRQLFLSIGFNKKKKKKNKVLKNTRMLVKNPT